MIKSAEIKRCLLCGRSNFKFLYLSKDRMFNLPGDFNVKKCSSCSLLFLDPQPSVELLKKHYPSKNYYSYSKSSKKGFFEILREYLVVHYYSPNALSLFMSTFIQNVPAMPSHVINGKILDIGCGAGDTLVLFKKLGWDTYGIDIDPQAIQNARSRGLSNVSLGTYKDISKYPDNYFDAIRLYHVIEHIDNPSLCLKLIRQKLKKDGELIIGTPNSSSIISNIFRSYWYNLDSPRHLFLFSPQTLGKLLKKNGFSVNKIEFCSAGGIAGSLQYTINGFFNKRIDFVHKIYIVLLFYSLEWFLNKLRTGDVFVVRAKSL